MINVIQNTIGALQRKVSSAASIITQNLQLWLDFEKSEVVGGELVVNGSFENDSSWSLDSSTTIANGLLSQDGTLGRAFQSVAFLEGNQGTVVKVEFTVDRIDSGSFQINCYGLLSEVVTQPGSYSITGTTTNSTNLYVNNGGATADGDISIVSVKEVTQFAKDKSPNTNNAKLFTGKALSFNGNDAVSDFGNPNINLKSICFWVDLDTTTEQLFNLTATHSIEVVSGVITLNGTWSNSNIYVDGVATTSIGTTPKRVVITTDTNILVDDLEFARIGTDYGSLDLADVQIYDAEFTLADALLDYNNPNHLIFDVGGSIALSNLKGYWALSEGDGLVAYDSSGEANNGTINGATHVDKQPTIPQLGMMDWSKVSNLITYSEDFTDSSWNKNNVTVTANSIASPRGSVDASLIQEAVFASNIPSLDLTNSIVLNAGTYTYSFYVKNNNGRYLGVSLGSNSERVRTNFDFDTQTFKAIIVNGTTTGSASFTTSGDFYRISITATFPSSTAVDTVLVPLATDTYPFFAFQASDTRSFYLWGAQLEEGTSASGYLRTEASAVTDVTLIQDPNNKGYDILGNPLRLREHGFNLDGSGYAEVADNSSLQVGNNLSIGMWVKPSNTSNAAQNLIYKDSWYNGYGIYLINDINIRLYLDSSHNTSSMTLTLDAWNYVVATYDGSDIRFYLDGGIVGSPIPQAATINSSGHNLFIGSNENLGEKYEGLIDELLIYNRALTPTEITNNYNVGLVEHSASSSYSDDYASDYGL